MNWCIYNNLLVKSVILVFDFYVLVGAFSVFGRADTGKPVQIFAHSPFLLPILGILGLI